MIKIKIADKVIDIHNKYRFIVHLCKDYIVEDEALKCDFEVDATDEEIESESTQELKNLKYLESLAIYRKIADKMPHHSGFLMHGVIIDFDGVGIAFLAKSGVGKSTHMMNWKETFGDRVTVVNGDKPLIKIIDGVPYAYGTPWAGKEFLQTNMRTRLQKICFIERDEVNSCVPFDGDVFKRLLPQIYRSKDPITYFQTLDLVKAMTENTEQYIIKCNKDISSAAIAKEAMFSRTGIEHNRF